MIERNWCEHSCAVEGCEAVFTHTGAHCSEGYFGRVCKSCEMDGWYMGETPDGEWGPRKQGVWKARVA